VIDFDRSEKDHSSRFRVREVFTQPGSLAVFRVEVAVEQHLGWEDSNSEMSLYKRLGRTPWFSRMFSYQRLFALPRG
jgi:hypothetical protein